MGVQDLMETVDTELRRKKEKQTQTAKESIAKYSDKQEAAFNKYFPSLFINENPIKKWVMIEPDSSSCGGDESGSLAAVINVQGKDVILYTYRNSFADVFALSNYEQGSSYCWAKKPVGKYLEKELSGKAKVNEENLASMISTFVKEY
jgi:hypothetical protein